MTKPHLVASEEPLNFGSDITAACGTVVHNAHWVWMSDDKLCPEVTPILTSLNSCQKCMRADLEGRYLYGIVSGQERQEMEAA